MIPRARVRLDSSHPHNATWACPPAHATMLLRCNGINRPTTLLDATGVVRQWPDPLDALAWLEQDAAAGPKDRRWIGYLSYDLGRLFETLPAIAIDDLDLPLFAFMRIESPTQPAAPIPAAAPEVSSKPRALQSTFSRDQYLTAVRAAIEYIRAGDVFQVNLSQRFTASIPDAPQVVYSRLLKNTPAWYGGLLDFGDHVLICNSPELFLHVGPDPTTGQRIVTTRPIKGTRPRGVGNDIELRDSIKDQAELNMIVDLERNDLGRVCRTGSVKVIEPRTIEAHPTVFHGAATVRGVLRDDIGFVDLLRAVFPGGSITGAPKIRAMQIIETLEPVRRGPYCGAVGYLASGGRIEFNVAIRTMIVKDGLVHIPVGGGIVADSDPAAEYEETLTKSQALLTALGLSLR